MIKKINHLGIAVDNLEDGIKHYRDVLGLKLLGIEEVAEQKVKVAMFEAGEVHIELLEPTSPESPIAKHLEKKGPGMHHISFEVDDVQDSLNEYEEKGVALIDKTPRDGAGGWKIAFLHPKSTGKVLTELNSK